MSYECPTCHSNAGYAEIKDASKCVSLHFCVSCGSVRILNIEEAKEHDGRNP